uniref:Uncharacterized protein n=1 Tax=Chromera velia CCMP2878 TaxID=1169474 RepID=A0A0G4HWG2_9ALVE|eukprot:Cvel_9030.t1-p1 / transcript=Cvel_9030.t1 / gene=Cvel_9030 / organism=Chromera_velia_CCMP2878 / gene_product=hypothetical protein / transcript_product=hypothetical protein / location=Cvel_scaffold512:8441-12939(+) / protein_length=795 / sequence_SO=supercontig / SO=protein_coding / is_pseudo=false
MGNKGSKSKDRAHGPAPLLPTPPSPAPPSVQPSSKGNRPIETGSIRERPRRGSGQHDPQLEDHYIWPEPDFGWRRLNPAFSGVEPLLLPSEEQDPLQALPCMRPIHFLAEQTGQSFFCNLLTISINISVRAARLSRRFGISDQACTLGNRRVKRRKQPRPIYVALGIPDYGWRLADDQSCLREFSLHDQEKYTDFPLQGPTGPNFLEEWAEQREQAELNEGGEEKKEENPMIAQFMKRQQKKEEKRKRKEEAEELKKQKQIEQTFVKKGLNPPTMITDDPSASTRYHWLDDGREYGMVRMIAKEVGATARLVHSSKMEKKKGEKNIVTQPGVLGMNVHEQLHKLEKRFDPSYKLPDDMYGWTLTGRVVDGKPELVCPTDGSTFAFHPEELLLNAVSVINLTYYTNPPSLAASKQNSFDDYWSDRDSHSRGRLGSFERSPQLGPLASGHERHGQQQLTFNPVSGGLQQLLPNDPRSPTQMAQAAARRLQLLERERSGRSEEDLLLDQAIEAVGESSPTLFMHGAAAATESAAAGALPLPFGGGGGFFVNGEPAGVRPSPHFGGGPGEGVLLSPDGSASSPLGRPRQRSGSLVQSMPDIAEGDEKAAEEIERKERAEEKRRKSQEEGGDGPAAAAASSLSKPAGGVGLDDDVPFLIVPAKKSGILTEDLARAVKRETEADWLRERNARNERENQRRGYEGFTNGSGGGGGHYSGTLTVPLGSTEAVTPSASVPAPAPSPCAGGGGGAVPVGFGGGGGGLQPGVNMAVGKDVHDSNVVHRIDFSKLSHHEPQSPLTPA